MLPVVQKQAEGLAPARRPHLCRSNGAVLERHYRELGGTLRTIFKPAGQTIRMVCPMGRRTAVLKAEKMGSLNESPFCFFRTTSPNSRDFRAPISVKVGEKARIYCFVAHVRP
ncbi:MULTISPECIES: hypothetical protein [Paenibacillus]|uniref:hypothetical protein n=1 Tax=Paenibacillus TaxID=44249 RepID=UPI002FE203CA